jgi:hypothetical protein
MNIYDIKHRAIRGVWGGGQMPPMPTPLDPPLINGDVMGSLTVYTMGLLNRFVQNYRQYGKLYHRV